MWFATNAGMWAYDPRDDKWEIRRLVDEPEYGQVLMARTRDKKTIYWAHERIVAAYDVTRRKWTELWKKDSSYYEGAQRFFLSPDERYVWRVHSEGVFVGNLKTNGFVKLTDKDSPGLGSLQVVQFHTTAKRALVGTPRGVVICDYSGKVKTSINRSSCPLTNKVVRFVFAPDGGEIWCIQETPRGFTQSAVVLYPDNKRWEEVPEPKTRGWFYDVIFSKDGKTTWLSVSRNSQEGRGMLERTRDDRRWAPIRIPMPENYTRIARFWLSPKGDELWLEPGSGLLRVKLATKDLSQYAKSDFRGKKVQKHFPLIAEYVRDLVFTSDGRYAVCSASSGKTNGITLIDLKSGKSQDFQTKDEVTKMSVSADQNRITCEIRGRKPPVALDIKQRKLIAVGKEPAPSTSIPADRIRDSLKALARKAGLLLVSSAESADDRHVVCELASQNGQSSIQLFDAKTKSLTKLKDIGSASVTAMQLGPNGIVWTALPGCVISVDARTGKLSVFD